MTCWHQTCRTWPSGVTFNKLASSSCAEVSDNYNTAILTYIWIGVLAERSFLTFETAYIAQGGSTWSLRGPQSHDDKPEKRHSLWRFKRDKSQRAGLETRSTAPNTVLTISWHHTHCLPAKVLIFLWQTWHLPELLSVRIHSWAAIWENKERKVEEGNVPFSIQASGLWPPRCPYQWPTQLPAGWNIFLTALFSF